MPEVVEPMAVCCSTRDAMLALVLGFLVPASHRLAEPDDNSNCFVD